MGSGNRPIGPLGSALLGVAAIASVLLAVHGWSARQLPLAIGSVGGGPSRAAGASAGSSSSPPAAGPHPTATGGGAASPAPAPGPLLSSQQYAPYSFRVWPGTLSNASRAAMTGLRVTVHSKSGGIDVAASVIGQPAPAPVFYPGGARVYIIEAAMGDDSGNSDFNLGDDGIVVTDARGRILR